MSEFAVSGLMSGIDTDAIVKAVMAVEQLPQRAMQNKIGAAEREVKALQGVNSKASSLASFAEDFDAQKLWSSMNASSNKESVSVSAADGSNPIALKFDVTQLAEQHSEVSPVMTWEEGVTEPAASTIEFHSIPKSPPASLLAQVSVANADPREIAQAVNSAGAGFTAQAIQVAPNQYRLQVTRTEGGAAGTFSFNIDTTPPTDSTTLQTGQDAKIQFGPGFEVTSPTNTFTGLADGVDVTVSEIETGVSIESSRGVAAASSKVSELIEKVNAVLKDVKTVTHIEVGNDAATGVLAGSSVMRSLSTQLTSASSGIAGGSSASLAGIELKRSGEITFDASKFRDIMNDDPALAQRIVEDLVGRVQSVADQYSNSSSGIVSSTIKNKESDVADMNDRVDAWDRRLEMRRAALVRQYTAMESAMAKFQGQASWLSSQVAGMSGAGQN